MNEIEVLTSILESSDPVEQDKLFNEAYRVKLDNVGDKVYLRGLIEISNVCSKNCFYCGIRRDSLSVDRYELDEKSVIDAALFAMNARYGSIVIQGGERSDRKFTDKITHLLKEIKSLSNNKLGVTLSLGEQDLEVYKEWFEAGAHRYLLRIETSNEELYRKLHPQDSLHSFDNRVKALEDLREAGYQVGTGVMIGLPFQTYRDLAEDLLFIRKMNVDMVGMGPYLEHSGTPLYSEREQLLPPGERLNLALKMVALLRLLMPDINIAATTALQVLDTDGRERAVLAGANVIMPNMTINEVRSSYQIYENKPGIEDDAQVSKSRLEANLAKMNIPIGWDEWGDSKHFAKFSQEEDHR